jgi:POT family proton-dependent oligopeptide transporter
MTTADTAAPERQGPQLFGHPLGLTWLFMTEMAERFSYYGMRAILVLYLVNFLLLHPQTQAVVGFEPIKYTFEWIAAVFSYGTSYLWHYVSGGIAGLANNTVAAVAIAGAIFFALVIDYLVDAPDPGAVAVEKYRRRPFRAPVYTTVLVVLFGGIALGLAYYSRHGLTIAALPTGVVVHDMAVQPLSSLIYGNYTAFVYLTPFFGGIIADRYIGQRVSVIIGGFTMAVAEFTLMSPKLFFIGLLLLIVGNGFFKPNISTQVGNLYKPGDARIDRAYSIFYVGINVGAALSPVICGSLGENVGYHWGFFAAGIGMLIGQVVYLLALRNLPPDRLARLKAAPEAKKKLTARDWNAVVALILLCIPTSLFWAVYEQQGNTISLWAQDFTDRRLIPGLVDWQIPVTLFQSFNPVMIFTFTPLVVLLWGMQSKRKREPSTVSKMAIGNFLLAMSYVVMAAAAYETGSGHASWLWLFAFFAVITLGELYLSPIGLALVARVAPAQILSMMMGLWFITSFVGNQLQGVIGSFFSQMDKVQFFLLCASVGASASVITWLFERPLRSVLEARPVHAPLAAEPQADPHIEPQPRD